MTSHHDYVVPGNSCFNRIDVDSMLFRNRRSRNLDIVMVFQHLADILMDYRRNLSYR